MVLSAAHFGRFRDAFALSPSPLCPYNVPAQQRKELWSLHMCGLIQRLLMLYVYCFEFMLLASRLQNSSRMSFSSSHPQTIQNKTGPAIIQADVLYLLCILSAGSTIFFPSFYLDCTAIRTNSFFFFFFPVQHVKLLDRPQSDSVPCFLEKSSLQKDLGGEGKHCSIRLMVYSALSKSAINRK